ncbi:MAG: hypothetical protein AAF566_13740 [Pseudomonadota bacterium]
MGEGLFWRRDAVTAYAEPYDHLTTDENHQDDFDEAYQDFEGRVRQAAGPSYWGVGNAWGPDKDRIVLRNGLFEITFYEDSYARVHVSLAISSVVEGRPEENFARARLHPCAKAFFDRLEETDPLRVRACAWTSRARAS